MTAPPIPIHVGRKRNSFDSVARSGGHLMNEDVLSGDNLCLPDQSNGHSAESENAERENKTHIGFGGRNAERSN